MSDLLVFLQARSRNGLLPWAAQFAASQCFRKGLAEVEEIALANGLLPARYQRNRAMLSVPEQHRLFARHVAVIGCGGLGGYVLAGLARLGIGRITAIDPDCFEEHNLNRQLLSSIKNLGQPKVAAAVEQLGAINPAVTVIAYQEAFGMGNGERLLRGADVVVDCLDSVTVRLELAEVCTLLGIPLVHGAIGGWYGHVSTVLPGALSFDRLYGNNDNGKGVEVTMGNPSFTPAVVAALEVAEVCKLLLDKGSILDDRALSIDLLDMEFTEITL
ncbi:HesA/MoeB/ThiF family protein [Malonomonas rubra]|uniref:HesA/MoeB/ThiF family protein n=1 Tax=Malonomonas rubra TaxID=57040 RepID=UPI0026E9CFD9|nr:HesA/MoeB/ThiF family protein [Malonomonas rubra]